MKDLSHIEIPFGMTLIKKGGRPKADARNLAVLLTRLWRTGILGEQVKRADAWILEHWQNSNGITEESSIRRAIRLAKDGPMIGHFVLRYPNFYNPQTTEAVFDGPTLFQVLPEPEYFVDGSIIWTWKEGMKHAHQYVARPIRCKFEEVTELGGATEERPTTVTERRPTPPLPGIEP